jgi:glycosyltransferase involved in cell wall biosynthesis
MSDRLPGGTLGCGMPSDLLTVVIAVFNEAETLPLLHPRLSRVLDDLARNAGVDARVLYVDDGSHDASWPLLQSIAAADSRVSLLRLSRNFGKEAALTAGLDRVDEGAALILDADGQDPPELIPQFVAKWREGFDDVHGTRTVREGEGWLKTFTAHRFYRLIGRLSKTPIPEDTGDFRLLSPRALAALRQLRERHRFMKGLFGWIGFEQVAIAYERAPRLAGRTKFNFWPAGSRYSLNHSMCSPRCDYSGEGGVSRSKAWRNASALTKPCSPSRCCWFSSG